MKTNHQDESWASSEAHTEQALRASETSYRRLFEAAKDGILILDVDTGRINDVNPYLFNLLGFSRSEMVGKTVGELSPFKDIESNKVMLERLQRDGYVRYENLPLETRDGRHIAVEFVSNVYEAGDHNVIQCNVRDITERKHAEDEIRRFNAELEKRVIERTAQLEAFSYSVSHDLRAPLSHILDFVKSIQEDAGSSLSEKTLGHLTIIFQSAKKMANLIDDLLAFSQVGRAELQKQEVNLEELGATSVVVTHDRELAFGIAHRIAMLDEGRIIATGTPDEMKANPDPRVQQFLNAKIPQAPSSSAHVLPNVSIPGRDNKLPLPVAPDDEVRQFGVAPAGHLHLATPAMAAKGRKSS